MRLSGTDAERLSHLAQHSGAGVFRAIEMASRPCRIRAKAATSVLI
jgi:hypothetical protein